MQRLIRTIPMLTLIALLPLMQGIAQRPSAVLASSSPSAVSPAALREFRIDAGHSEVGFSIGFLGRPVRGRFDEVRGTLVYAAGNLQASGKCRFHSRISAEFMSARMGRSM